MGGNAWAEAGDETTNANISFTGVASGDVITGGSYSGTVNSIAIGSGQFRSDQTDWLSLYDATSTITIPVAERAGSKDVVQVQFKMAWGNKNGMGSGFSLKDAEGDIITNFLYARWDGSATNANNMNIDMTGLVGAHTSNKPIKERYTIFDVIIDYAANTITSEVECVNTDGKGTHNKQTFYATLTNTNPIATLNFWGYNVGGNSDRASIINDILIKTTEGDYSVEYADYTVHFVDNNGVTVKDDAVRSGVVGSTVNANSEDKTTFYSGGYKYVYANDGDGVEVANDGSAELTVTYTKKGQYTYNVYAVNSSSVKLQEDPIATATTYEGDEATLKWSKYIKIGGTWYVSSESTFSATATEAGSKNVIYTPADGIDYFFEFENLTKTGSFAATEDGVELSNKNAARFSKSSKVWTSAIAAGTYTLNIYCKGTNAKSPTLPMYYCDTDGSNLVYIGEATACQANNWELKEKTGVVIPEGKALCLYNTDDKNNSNYLVDYFTLTRTGDATVSKTITSAGWATYCSPYALDFSGDIANLTDVYIVTGGSAGVLTKTSVNGGTVPANTGLLLKGTEGTVTIPVVATGSTDVSANKLVGVTANTEIAAEAGYVLMNDATNGLAFYKNKNAFTVGANTAYLSVDFADAAARFDSFSFDDETTGITQIENGKSNIENSVYNLNGQRVSKPKNGLYIVNGKKVIVK